MTTGSIPAPGTLPVSDARAGAAETARRPPRAAAASPPQVAGMLWFAGWLFTIGFAQLVWWKAILALLLWPYFLGVIAR